MNPFEHTRRTIQVAFTLVRDVCGIESQLTFERTYHIASAEDEAILFDLEMKQYPGWVCGCYSYIVQ